ncbi:DUF4157 domain-containing protein [Parabacteroides sp. OttesenSCG-928-B22]|nr:DUF4157 domain-containing protein [Parabacteroides sp. OttesenSCG-928-B22]
MKTQEKKPEAVSHTLQAKSGKTHQPPATTVLQAYKEGVIQREADEEEEPLQMKSQQSPANAAVLQAYKEGVVQREIEEEEEPLQMKKNQTGLPDNLKSGVEALSGYSMDDVRVHYNSSQPAQFQALAYTQGTNIHVAPGQEQHLAHEAWHVVQQKQGRVQPTMQMKGVQVNDDQGLEREADQMGGKAIQAKVEASSELSKKTINSFETIQRVRVYTIEDKTWLGDLKKTHLTIDAARIHVRQLLKEHKVYKDKNELRQEVIDTVDDKATGKIPAQIYDISKEKKGYIDEMEINESLILVSHGGPPMLVFNPIFGDYSPKKLAQLLYDTKIIPVGYSGEIYIDGCNTARGKKSYDDGTSFIHLFKKKMQKKFKNKIGNFTVKGNLGFASTSKAGGEGITIDSSNIEEYGKRLLDIVHHSHGDKDRQKKYMAQYHNSYKYIKTHFAENPSYSVDIYGKGGKYVV